MEASSPEANIYDASTWELVKYLKVDSLQQPEIDPGGNIVVTSAVRNIDVYLLRSLAQNGLSGVGAPLYDEDFIIARGSKVLYQFTASSSMLRDEQNEIAIKNVTNDNGTTTFPEIIFSTYGSVGASDYLLQYHILQYQPTSDSFKDIANPNFYDSATSGFKWFTLNFTTYGLVAFPTGTRQCHFCDSNYIYTVYLWNSTSSSFMVYKTFTSDNQYAVVAWPEMITEVDKKMVQ